MGGVGGNYLRRGISEVIRKECSGGNRVNKGSALYIFSLD